MYRILLLLVLAGCASEFGEVSATACPHCPDAFAGYETCAFFEAAEERLGPRMLIDDENHEGIGIPVRVPGYMHHKFCFNATHASFGSANPTYSGLHTGANLLVEMESRRLSRAFASEYQHLKGRWPGWHRKDWTFNGRPLSVLFCPRDGCEERILVELGRAEEEIVFLTFVFTSKPIAALLLDKHAAGVEVSGILEPRSRNILGSRYEQLTAAGIEVLLPRTGGTMHHKAFLIDGERAVIGSYNPSASANTRNAETVVITEEPAVIEVLRAEHARLRRIADE